MYKKCEEILKELEAEGKIKVWWGFKFPEKEELKVRLKDVLEENVEEKYYLSDAKISSISGWKAHQKPFERVQGRESVCPTLTARGAGEEHSGMVLYSDKLEGTTNLQEEITCERIGGILDTEKSTHQAGSIWDKEGLSPTLDTMQGGWRQPLIIASTQAHAAINEDGVSPTLTRAMGAGGGNVPIVVDNDVKPSAAKNFEREKEEIMNSEYRIRKLTPRETWRLMGFTDAEFEKAAKVCSPTQQYKQAGNSICVPVLEGILKNLFTKEGEE